MSDFVIDTVFFTINIALLIIIIVVTVYILRLLIKYLKNK
jgi:hypothetical protein